MLVHETLYDLRLEIAVDLGIVGAKPVDQLLTQCATLRKPVIQGNAEAGLFPFQELRSEMLSDDAFQKVLAGPLAGVVTAQIHVPRYPRRKFRDTHIGQRRPAFQAMNHARDIDLRENVVGQIGLIVDELADLFRADVARLAHDLLDLLHWLVNKRNVLGPPDLSADFRSDARDPR